MVMAFLDEKQRIEARLDELQQIRLVWLGKVSLIESELTDAEATVAAVEGGIGELRALLARYETPEPDMIEE